MQIIDLDCGAQEAHQIRNQNRWMETRLMGDPSGIGPTWIGPSWAYQPAEPKSLHVKHVLPNELFIEFLFVEITVKGLFFIESLAVTIYDNSFESSSPKICS